MDKQQLEATLKNFLKAWEDKSIESVVDLLSDKFEYFETPLEKPLTEKEEIIELWKPVPEVEADIVLSFETMSIGEKYGLFRITGTYSETDVKKKYMIDRIFLLAVDENGLIKKFMQWRESKEE